MPSGSSLQFEIGRLDAAGIPLLPGTWCKQCAILFDPTDFWVVVKTCA
jgi:hypothetical protein